MTPFRVGLSGDFLNEQGEIAYGDIRLDLLEGEPRIRYHFIRAHSPPPFPQAATPPFSQSPIPPSRPVRDPAYWDRLYSMDVTQEQIEEVDGLIVLRPWVKRSVFQRGGGDLVVIGRSGAGYDKIDVQACTENDVAVFNAPLALNHSTASSALMFILALAKKLLPQDRVVREGRWDRQAQVLGSEIQGRTLGIIGLGHSGRELVRLAAPFQMPVLAFSPHADPALAAELGVRLVSLEELLREADFLSLHCRLTPETRRLLGAAELSRMKASAFLINVARGELIDQQALVEALREGRIAGAALDVFEREPLPPEDPLTRLENVILAPHWSASTSDVWKETGRAMAEGMLAAAHGRAPQNVVNPEVLERPGFREKLARFANNPR